MISPLKKTKTVSVAMLFLVAMNLLLLLSSYVDKQEKKRFEEINVERINIIEKDGTIKLAISNSDKFKGGTGNRKNGVSFSGLMFYNEDGFEAGGLIFDGKHSGNVQYSSAGLMFDQYRQDQVVALQHNEYKDSLGSMYNDGLAIIARPDYSVVKEEYRLYDSINKFKGTEAQKDSMWLLYAMQDKVLQRKLFLGSKRGVKDSKKYEETGLFISNRLGRQVLRIYVDIDNVPHIDVMDSTGKIKKYELASQK